MVSSPEVMTFGVGVRGCVIPDLEKSRRATKAKPRKIFYARCRWGIGRVCALGRLGCGELGREGCGDFGEKRMLLDDVREFLDPKVNGAASNAVACGVAMHAFQCAVGLA